MAARSGRTMRWRSPQRRKAARTALQWVMAGCSRRRPPNLRNFIAAVRKEADEIAASEHLKPESAHARSGGVRHVTRLDCRVPRIPGRASRRLNHPTGHDVPRGRIADEGLGFGLAFVASGFRLKMS